MINININYYYYSALYIHISSSISYYLMRNQMNMLAIDILRIWNQCIHKIGTESVFCQFTCKNVALMYRLEFQMQLLFFVESQRNIFFLLFSIALTTFLTCIHQSNHEFELLDFIILSDWDLNSKPFAHEPMNVLTLPAQGTEGKVISKPLFRDYKLSSDSFNEDLKSESVCDRWRYQLRKIIGW